MAGHTYQVRVAQRHELDTMLQWAAEEGWNPGLHDAASFHAADSGGFLIGLLNEEPIASISVVRYGADYGFLGLYIVKPEHRGRGYGLRIWNAGLEHLGNRAVGLDGVVAQQDNYRRSGFSPAHRNIRHQGTASSCAIAPDPGITPLSRVAPRLILDYDRAFFPSGRDAFLQGWLSQPDAQAVGLMREDRLTGYGVARPCQAGYKIGPLFADTPEGAASLLGALCQRLPLDSPVFLDIPETHDAAMSLAQKLGMAPMFETARMYKGNPDPPAMDRTYGITTFELG